MKIWIVKIGANSKTFFNEVDFNRWLISTTDAVSNRIVEIFEATPLESKTVKEIKESIKDSNARDSKIQAVVSDDPWFSKFENFKVELVKFSNTQSFVEKLNMLGSDQKVIVKFLKSQKEFLLCDVSEDVKWFESVIDVTGVKEMIDFSIKNLNGWNTRVMVSNKRKESFEKAKANLDKKSK